ncbi:MAG: FAD/NAD(P)-binding protein [Alphaproteobacteria bacterium]
MRVAILGFGFSGAMLAANLARLAEEPLELYLIDPTHDARGAAYGTTNAGHLLNVRATNMGAFADAPGGFAEWLLSDEGKYAAARRKIALPGPQDFAPRALYGDYLADIWQRTQSEAQSKRLSLKLVPARATRIERQGDGTLAVSTDRGDAIAVDAAVLATGVEPRPILTHLPPESVVQRPWKDGALAHAGKFMGPVVLVGTGLTAIDALISLRDVGYTGEVVALSRRGLWPLPHAENAGPYHFEPAALQGRSPVQLLRTIRRAAKAHMAQGGDWRAVIDALRPHTQALWLRWDSAQQRKFLARLLPYWNVHRHRVAPSIAARLDAERAAGTLRTIAGGRVAATVAEGRAQLEILRGGEPEMLQPSLIVNCTGPELNPAKSAHALLPQLLQSGMAEAHANGIGFAGDRHGRLFGAALPNLYAIGAPLTGQLLESTAVPELRVQAQNVAKQILSGRA